MADRDLPFWTPLYLGLTLLIGGAGVGYPLLESVEELGALALLLLCAARRRAPLAPLGRAMIWLWLFCLTVPALQLIPLPPAIWTALPDRSLATEISRLVGMAHHWRPISLLPERTVRGLLALLPPGAILVATLRLPTAAKWRLVEVIVGFGLLGVLVGAAQFASGSGDGVTPFETDQQGYPVGLFVNRNHQATFLLIAMMMSGALGARAARRSGGTARLLASAYAFLMALGTIATTSRMGTTLTPVALLITVLILFGDRLNWKTALSGAALAAIVVIATLQSGTVQRTLNRNFSAAEDERSLFWQDSWTAIQRSIPIGSGIGSFEPTHEAFERLEHVGPDVPNHAHNDFLELIMDAGAAAIAGLVALFVITVVGAFRLARLSVRSDQMLLGSAGLGGLVITLIHSLVDYPLRMTALAALFATCAAFLATRDRLTAGSIELPFPRARIGTLVLPGVAAGAVGLASIANAVSLYVTPQVGLPDLRWAPWNSSFASQTSTLDFLAGKNAAAVLAARQALAVAPTDVVASRTIGLVGDQNDPAGANPLMGNVARLGWRDRWTQYWAMERGFETGDVSSALSHTDALLRQGILTEPLFAMLHQAVHDPKVRAATADHLIANPHWAAPYLVSVDRLTPDQLTDHAQLLALVAQRAPVMARDGIARTADRLVAMSRIDAAEALWNFVEPFHIVHDGGFQQIVQRENNETGPFGWKLSAPVAIRVTIGSPGDSIAGSALHLQSEGVATAAVASQLVRFPPGQSILRFAATEPPSALSSSIEWRLSCLEAANRPPLRPIQSSRQTGGWTSYRSVVDIPTSGCRFQKLELWSIATTPVNLWIDEVSALPTR